MESPGPWPATGGLRTPVGGRKPLKFWENAKKRKHSFLQFFAMTGILMLSFRSLGQKYRINDLTEDAAALREEQEGLIARKDRIKRRLLDEADAEPTGAFAARLRVLFGSEELD